MCKCFSQLGPVGPLAALDLGVAGEDLGPARGAPRRDGGPLGVEAQAAGALLGRGDPVVGDDLHHSPSPRGTPPTTLPTHHRRHSPHTTANTPHGSRHWGSSPRVTALTTDVPTHVTIRGGPSPPPPHHREDPPDRPRGPRRSRRAW